MFKNLLILGQEEVPQSQSAHHPQDLGLRQDQQDEHGSLRKAAQQLAQDPQPQGVKALLGTGQDHLRLHFEAVLGGQQQPPGEDDSEETDLLQETGLGI